ncbi:radical SAM/SPASM domain-containing protein [Marinilabilia rubra]|uniref:Radical SAM protein n=1 Tax=Marinilabilia rubra TaxID=2162893 RepID=A0A2U2B9G4_9BACT|nr:radical SAM protein [Marinilabilia rubra]PWD99683.1 radical SAM protein [Marinilabilia rubra]
MWFNVSAIFVNLCLYSRTFTFRRLFNLLKLGCGFSLSRIHKKPVCIGRPYALSMEPSGNCQLKCPECPTGAAILSRSKGLLGIPVFEKTINETADYLIHLNLYFQGEPLMHPKLSELVKIANNAKIYTVISTNGLLLGKRTCKKLIEAGLSQITVSLDGYSQPVYETYRKGGHVEDVKKGILNLIEARSNSEQRNPLIVVQSLAFEHNIPEIPEIKNWCKQAGVDKLEIKSVQINDFGDGSVKPWEGNSRYEKDRDGSTVLKGKSYNHCWRHWSSAVISWNGDVAPCCYDKDIEYNMGNTSTIDFNKIWKHQNYNNFRHRILYQRAKIKMCQNCPEGRNWLM